MIIHHASRESVEGLYIVFAKIVQLEDGGLALSIPMWLRVMMATVK